MVPKFQLGGVINPISTFKPINIETAPSKVSGVDNQPTKPFKPDIPKTSGTKSSGSTTDPLKGALESDRLYLMAQKQGLMNSMQQRALTPGYYENGGAQLDAQAAQEMGTLFGTAKAKADQFKTLKTKFANSGDEIASDGEVVFVQDKSGNYSIVPYKEAVTKKDSTGARMYTPQSIATAINIRSTQQAFSGYSQQGAALEKIIGGVVDSSKFNKTLQSTFKAAGSIAGDVFVDSIGNEVPMEDLINAMQGGGVKSNTKQLANIVNNLTSNLSAGELAHLRTQAWEDYRRSNPATPNPTQWVDNRMQEILHNNALSYLKSTYYKDRKSGDSDEDKAKAAAAKAKQKEMDELMSINEYDLAKMRGGEEDTTIQSDSAYSGLFTDLGGGDTQITFKTSVIGTDKTNAYKDSKKEGLPNDFVNNGFIQQLGLNPTLPDGTLIKDMETKVTMVPNSPVKVLHDVPMKYENGRWVLAKDYMAFYSLLGEQLKKEIANVMRVETPKIGVDKARQKVVKLKKALEEKAKRKVLEELEKYNKDNPTAKKSIPKSGEKIMSKTVAMVQILTDITEDMDDPKYSYLKSFTARDKGGISTNDTEFYNSQIFSNNDEMDADELGKSVALIVTDNIIGGKDKAGYFNTFSKRKKEIVADFGNMSNEWKFKL